jgi:nitroreductase
MGLLVLQACCFGQEGQTLKPIKLNPPALDRGVSIMQALKNRKSTREISDAKLSLQQLSEVLWAANGVNRDDGKRTAPAAMNMQIVDIYVVLQEGVYLYDAVKHELLPVAEGDFRKEAGRQDFVYIAPVNLVYVLDSDKFKAPQQMARSLPDEEKVKWACVEAGCQAQNVGLYCASEGLGSVVRGSVDQEALGKTMKLRPTQTVVLAQTVGHPKAK